MADQCNGIMGRIFGHAYEAVYDTAPVSPSPLAEFDRVSIASVRDILAANTSHTYRGHVCRRCGHQTNKEQ